MNERVFEKSLPSMLLEAREAVMKVYRPILERSDISELQWRILRIVVQHGEMHPSAIAERGFVPSPSLSRALRVLEERELVARDWDATDKRRVVIKPTEAGSALYAFVFPQVEAQNRRFEQHLTEPKKRELYEILRNLTEVAGTVAKTGG